MKLVALKNCPRLVLFASRDIAIDEEIAYDYGDDDNLWWRYESEEKVSTKKLKVVKILTIKFVRIPGNCSMAC